MKGTIIILLMHRNILLVDDDQDMIDLLTLFLGQSGYATAAVKDGYTALDQVNNHHFDLVILDKSMPFVTGDQVLKSLRNNHMTKDLPIIMLTANTELTDVMKSKNLGVDDYVLKPPEKKSLIARIEKVLGVRPKNFEYVFDEDSGSKLGQLSPPLQLLSISLGGIILKSPSPIKKGSLLANTQIKLFEMLGIDFSKLTVNYSGPRSDGTYETFVSFLPLSRSETEKIRDWILTKSLKKSKLPS